MIFSAFLCRIIQLVGRDVEREIFIECTCALDLNVEDFRCCRDSDIVRCSRLVLLENHARAKMTPEWRSCQTISFAVDFVVGLKAGFEAEKWLWQADAHNKRKLASIVNHGQFPYIAVWSIQTCVLGFK